MSLVYTMLPRLSGYQESGKFILMDVVQIISPYLGRLEYVYVISYALSYG